MNIEFLFSGIETKNYRTLSQEKFYTQDALTKVNAKNMQLNKSIEVKIRMSLMVNLTS